MPETVRVEHQPRPGLGRVIFKNTAILMSGSAALKVLNFLYGVYVVRRLGDHGMGQFFTAVSFAGLFSIFAELGMTQFAMREIAQDRDKTQSLFWNLIILRLLLAVVGIVGITLGAVVAGYSPVVVWGVFLSTCNFVLWAFLAPLIAVLTANERFDYVASATVLGQVVLVALGVTFLHSGRGFISLIAANLISVLPQIALAAWAIKRHHLAKLSFQIDPKTWPRLMRSGIPFGIISLTVTIATGIDTVMLSMFRSESVVGWYRVPYNLVLSLVFLFNGFKEAIVPSLSKTYIADPGSVQNWYYRSVRAIVILSPAMAVGGTVIAYQLVRFLYTRDFLPSALALQILIWDVPFLMFAAFCGNITTVVSKEKSAARIYTVNAVANVLLNLYAIPRFGLVGAALVTVLTDLISALQFHLLLRRKLILPNLTPVFIRVAFAGGLMGVVVRLAGDINLFLAIGLGAVTYGGLVLALRLIDETEWAMIFRLLRRVSQFLPTR